jgi:hypothetical protein
LPGSNFDLKLLSSGVDIRLSSLADIIDSLCDNVSSSPWSETSLIDSCKEWTSWCIFAPWTSSSMGSSNADDFQLQSERYQVYKRTGDLDLHSLRLTTALQVTRRALKEWWDEEIRLREQEGNLNRYGSEARFVDPIKVITGRGIHSTGGVSVIRRQVQYLLHTSNFIYIESVGHFVVRGHKK